MQIICFAISNKQIIKSIFLSLFFQIFTMKQNIEYPPIYIVSGGKGVAGHTVVHSLLVQYPNNNVPVYIFPDVHHPEQLDEIVEKANKSRALVTHTLVSITLRNHLINMCNSFGLKNIDFMGPLANYLENDLGLVSINSPGLFRQQNSQYFDRIDAMEYTLNHDDGLNPERLYQAEIILTGVSRAGKTPLSVYMSMFGWKVANVPLVNGIEPPKELFEVDPLRVFGLKISSAHLIPQRAKRLRVLKNQSNTDYIDQRLVNEEIRFADRIFEKGGFTTINVTNKPIESSANEIIDYISQRFGHNSRKLEDIPK